jgi:hypothetical protein
VIEDIEELGAKLQIDPRAEMELAMHRKIILPGAESPQLVASQAALLSRGCRNKRPRIEGLSSGILRAIQTEGLAGDDGSGRWLKNTPPGR